MTDGVLMATNAFFSVVVPAVSDFIEYRTRQPARAARPLVRVEHMERRGRFIVTVARDECGHCGHTG